MPGSSEYECGECRHRFRTPDEAPHDTRSLMCPACGSIDLNLMHGDRSATAVWSAREGAAAEAWRAHSSLAEVSELAGPVLLLRGPDGLHTLPLH